MASEFAVGVVGERVDDYVIFVRKHGEVRLVSVCERGEFSDWHFGADHSFEQKMSHVDD